jgi:hypothetical protein
MKYQPAGKSNQEHPSMGLLNCNRSVMMIKWHSKKLLVFLSEKYS